jgi:membrane protein implicated in regulation of membrane protease activity
MDMTTDASWWWIATGVLVAVEMASGTFYLLMLALGTAGAAIAAHLGLTSTVQMLVAAILGGGAVIVWHVLRGRQAQPLPAQANPDVNLDIGEQVHVDHWEPDGTAQVKYRGAMWSARYQGDDVPTPGTFVIRELQGSLLLLGRKG